MVNRTRKCSIKIRFTEKEMEKLNEDVKTSGLSREGYLRMMVNGYRPRSAPSEEVVEVIHQLRKIGTNLNQIAYVANATHRINEEEYRKNFVLLQHEIDRIMILLVSPIAGSSNNGNN